MRGVCLDILYVRGGNPLNGSIELCGAKNSILPLMCASLMCSGDSVFYNVPRLSDVRLSCDILALLGKKAVYNGGSVRVSDGERGGCTIPKEKMSGMRSSFMFLAPILARCGEAVVYRPGGCNLGLRPVDIHLEALTLLGASFRYENETLYASLEKGRFVGTDVKLRYPSVGASENVLCAAVTANGTTRIFGAAKEPEVCDLARYLRGCGADIIGEGTDCITVNGVERLYGCAHTVITDRIFASTIIAAAAATGGRVSLEQTNTDYLHAVIDAFERAGVRFSGSGHTLCVDASHGLCFDGCVNCEPYPGFPTDAGPLFVSAMCFALGGAKVYDSVFENRFEFAKQLVKMGADIGVVARTLSVRGSRMRGARLQACDLRGGAALVCAALASEGESTIGGVEYIDRGYTSLEKVFSSLGGCVRRYSIEQKAQ